MNKCSLLLIVLFSCSSKKLPISPEAKHYLDTIIHITQKNSLYKENVNWAIISDSMYLKAGSAQTTKEVIPAILYMLDALDDKHSFLLFNNVSYGNPPEKREHNKELTKHLKK